MSMRALDLLRKSSLMCRWAALALTGNSYAARAGAVDTVIRGAGTNHSWTRRCCAFTPNPYHRTRGQRGAAVLIALHRCITPQSVVAGVTQPPPPGGLTGLASGITCWFDMLLVFLLGEVNMANISGQQALVLSGLIVDCSVLSAFE
jgi:hypothetical protein